MTNREKLQSLNNRDFIQNCFELASNPMRDFIDWAKWCDAEADIESTVVVADISSTKPVKRNNISHRKSPVIENDTRLSRMIRKGFEGMEVTKTQCANDLHISWMTLSNWMLGKTIPNVKQTPDIVRYFGLDYALYQDARREAVEARSKSDKIIMDESIFRQRVTDERIRRGLSRDAVDTDLGLKELTTKRVEKGLCPITPSLVQKYSSYFHIMVDKINHVVA